MLSTHWQRLHIRLLLLILVSVMPAFAIIIYTAVEQRGHALNGAEQQAVKIARSVTARKRDLIRLSFDFASPVFAADDGVANLNPDWLGTLVAGAALPPGSILTLVDAKGIIVARAPDPEGWVGRALPEREMFLRLVAGRGRSTVDTTWLDGVRRVTHITPLDDAGDSGIYVRVGIPKDAVVGAVDDIFVRNLMLLTGAMAFVLGFGWLASERLVLRRVRDLAETARRFGAGELGARPHVPPDGGELGELARAFEEMADGIEERQRRIEYLATRDGLTELPNRSLLLDRVAQAIPYAARSGRCFALAVIDLDRLKVVNDSLGHGVGDALLGAVAERLLGSVRQEDTVARLEGDEFVLLLADLERAEAALAAARTVREAFLRPFQVDGHELHVTASLGVALYPNDGAGAEVLVTNAQSAMHRVKAEGGDGMQFYAAQMSADAAERLKLEQALRRALERGEFELHYQPKVDLRSGRIGSMEALIRWRHPELGMVPPARFITLAEETGLIVPIGDWVLRTACTQIEAWQAAGLAPLSVAVNLSSRQFWQGDLAARVSAILAETGVEPATLEFEVTESAVMRDLEETVAALAGLRSLGAAVSIDDFGTGYSSLGYLRRLPLDKLKIDRSFVNDLVHDPTSAMLTRQIIAIAHALKLRVIAEGVETEEQLRFLVANDCDEVQGFYFSRALPAAECRALLEAGKEWPLPGR